MNASAWMVIGVSPIVGSFLGVVIRRLPCGMPIVTGRSLCETCGTRLGPLDLVPLASYALLRGRCRHCDAPIAIMHPAVELASMTISVIATVTEQDTARLCLSAALGWALLTLAWIDGDTLRLPDILTLPLLLAGLAATAWITPEALTDHAAAAAAGYLGFRAIAAFYYRFRQKDGLGQGDAKLLAAAGAWVGLVALPWVIFAGASATLIFVGLQGKFRSSTVLPLGPGLAAGAWAVWLISSA